MSKFCRYCGKPKREEARFCRYCGRNLTAPIQNASGQPGMERGKTGASYVRRRTAVSARKKDYDLYGIINLALAVICIVLVIANAIIIPFRIGKSDFMNRSDDAAVQSDEWEDSSGLNEDGQQTADSADENEPLVHDNYEWFTGDDIGGWMISGEE